MPTTFPVSYAGTAAGAVLVLLSAIPAISQEVLGKTIQAKFIAVSCTTNGLCTPAQNGNINIYVSAQGRVFDYTGAEKGEEFILGVTKHRGKDSIIFTAGDNTLEAKTDIPGSSVVYVYTIHGNGCVVSSHGSYAKIRTKITMQSCSVVDGNPN